MRPDSLSELEHFFDHARDLMVIVGFDGYLKRVNASVVRTLGYSSQELLSRPFFEFVHPDDAQRTRDEFAGMLSGHDVVEFEVRSVCADGSVRWIQWNSRTVVERGFAYSVGRDVTDGRRADELAEEQAALRRVATLVAGETSPAEVFAAVAV